jgi:hypothetical protein
MPISNKIPFALSVRESYSYYPSTARYKDLGPCSPISFIPISKLSWCNFFVCSRQPSLRTDRHTPELLPAVYASSSSAAAICGRSNRSRHRSHSPIIIRVPRLYDLLFLLLPHNLRPLNKLLFPKLPVAATDDCASLTANVRDVRPDACTDIGVAYDRVPA